MRNRVIIISACVLTLLFTVRKSVYASSVHPVYDYELSTSGNQPDFQVHGPARIVDYAGRRGLNTLSIRSSVEIKRHTLSQIRGTVSLWFMSLEELSPFPLTPNLSAHNPHIRTYPFLSDCPNPQDFESARFKLVWDAGWHPNLMAMFARGGYLEAFDLPHRAFVTSSCFDFRKHLWYNLTLTWDYQSDEYALYVNGILVGKQDQFYNDAFHRDTVGSSLFTGNPALCFSRISFYDQILQPSEIYASYRAEATDFDPKVESELRHTYAGADRKAFDWEPDGEWNLEMCLSLTHAGDINRFYVQGNPDKVEVTEDGLLVKTTDSLYNRRFLEQQVYLWSDRTFEGDLYVEYEFNSLKPGGLSLLITQASGVNHEDFMTDYPLRTSGRMGMIFKEDVRNYHWEYYREMSDVRNDLASFAIIKNPFTTPIAFGCLDRQLGKNTWHKVQFLQTGNRLIGAINGIIVLDGTDDGFSAQGAVYDYGRIAIRCMLHTEMLFRNLKVYNKNRVKTIQHIEQGGIQPTKLTVGRQD